jgi:pyruvate kinase
MNIRRTKIICTIGPKTEKFEQLQNLAAKGMNVARLNMSHGTHEWHKKIIKHIHSINQKGDYSISILLDTKGTEIRTGDLKHEIELKKGEKFIFTVRKEAEYEDYCTEVSYDGFINDIKVNDLLLIDGGLLNFRVKEIKKPDVICECEDGGIMTSRRHISIAGKSNRGLTITKKDWEDIKFGVEQGVDFIALSFVKDEKAINLLKTYLSKQRSPVDVIAKIESAEALKHIQSIIKSSDGIMIARGDLGSEIPIEEIPLIQENIVESCRKLRKPVIVATHLLESMIVYPTPTRAEVTDITQAVMQKTDAIMLSGETASGKFPFKAITVMNKVAIHIEQRLTEARKVEVEFTNDPKMEISKSATELANNLLSSAILVFTRRGSTAALLSQCRPNSPIYAFTNTTTVRRKLNIYWGINSYHIEFSRDPEKTIQRAISLLKAKGLVKTKDKIIVVSDILVGKEFVETIQIRRIK